MAALHRAVASLLIFGDELEPSDVTEILGGMPTHSYKRGDDIRRRPDLPERLALRGHWRREANSTEPEDLHAQVLELLHGLTLDLEKWEKLCARFRIIVFCGWYMHEGNEGVEVAPHTLRLLADRGIGLSLDIYAPDCDA